MTARFVSPFPRVLPPLAVLILEALLIVDSSRAQDVVNDYGEASLLLNYEDRSLKSGHIALGPISSLMDGYLRFKQDTFQQAGFNYLVEVAPQYQYHLDGDAGSTANNESNLIAQWSLMDPGEAKRGNLLVWYQFSDTWGSNTTSDFSAGAGVLSPPNGGDTAPGDSRDLTQHFAWEQYSKDERWRVMVGKLTTRILFNTNRFTVSDREDFYTPMLVNNPVTHYTARVGIGAFVQYRQHDWYVSGMVRDADADLSKRFMDFDSLDSGNWEYVSEFGFTPSDMFGLGQGNYRFTASYSDATDDLPSSRTFSISADQNLGEGLGVFARYAWADDTFREFDCRLAGGLQFLAPLGFANDRVGIGAWWASPTDESLDDEYGVDVFWKLQISHWLELSPGLQINLNPALDPDEDRAVFAQLRLRWVL